MGAFFRKNWPWLLVMPFVAAAVAGWFLLPAELVVQVGVDGTPSNMMPKLAGVLVPVALAAFGGSRVCKGGKYRPAGILVLAVAAVVEVLLFAWNL
ncbi:MAG: hypothetical protein ACI4OU_05200 [Candidatus Enterenecus sp.]